NSLRLPGFVIARGMGTAAPLEIVARRAIGTGGSRQVGDVVLLPGPRPGGAFGQRLDRCVMQPGMPFRRHLGGFLAARVQNPAAFAAVQRPALVLVITVAELVGADELAVNPGMQQRSDVHGVSYPPDVPREYGTMRAQGPA